MANHYIKNKDFLAFLVKYKAECKLADEHSEPHPPLPEFVGECFIKIATNLSRKPNFVSYSFKEEMIGDAIENCLHRHTKILTIEYGPIEIENIVGKFVTVKCKDGVWRKAEVKKYQSQMLYEYGFGAFNTKESSVIHKVIATKDHRWFISSRVNGKKLVEYNSEVVTDLRVGDSLQQVPYIDGIDKEAILHGVIFGDGTGHKTTVYYDQSLHQQGNKYSFIRVCKQDIVKDEICRVLDDMGYTPRYPKHANGDPIYYIGKKLLIKDLPFTNDPSYIAGFIYGWWLADGNKTHHSNRKQISTTNKEAVDWLLDYAVYGGYQVTSVHKKNRKMGDGSFDNGKPLFIVNLASPGDYVPKVRYIKEYGIDETFCLVEPETNSFTLSNGLLTGNCLMYFRNFDETKSNNPFAYFTQIVHNAFIRRIDKEKKELYVKYKSTELLGILDEHDVLSDDGKMKQFEVYDNITDFIVAFEEGKRKKKVKKIKGIENFLEEEEIDE
jgi:hypothetical protein